MNDRYKILVVEDNEFILKVYVRILGKMFDLHTASSSAEAIQILQSTCEPYTGIFTFDLVLSDIDMPGGNGDEMFWDLLEMDRTLADRFMFATASTGTAERVALEAFDKGLTSPPVLRKPFRPEELIGMIYSVILRNPIPIEETITKAWTTAQELGDDLEEKFLVAFQALRSGAESFDNS